MAVPQVATDFHVADYDKVVKARVYISGLGLYQASLNGQLLDDTYFNPGESDYSKTVYYVTYDITKLLQSGPNAMEIRIGNGQFVNFNVNPVMLLDDQTEAPEHRYQKRLAGNDPSDVSLDVDDCSRISSYRWASQGSELGGAYVLAPWEYYQIYGEKATRWTGC